MKLWLGLEVSIDLGIAVFLFPTIAVFLSVIFQFPPFPILPVDFFFRFEVNPIEPFRTAAFEFLEAGVPLTTFFDVADRLDLAGGWPAIKISFG